MLRINPAAQVHDATIEEMLAALPADERGGLLICIGQAAAGDWRPGEEGRAP